MDSIYQRLDAAIAISTSLLVSVAVVMASTYQLSGTVRNQSGVSFSGATVEVIIQGAGTVIASTTTDSNGYYTLSVNGGTYNVRVTPPTGFQTSIALNRVINSDTVLDFVLVPSGVTTLSGRILDRLGNGLAGQNLNLSPAGGGSAIYTTTDGSGAYSYQVAPGSYSLQAYYYDYGDRKNV